MKASVRRVQPTHMIDVSLLHRTAPETKGHPRVLSLWRTCGFDAKMRADMIDSSGRKAVTEPGVTPPPACQFDARRDEQLDEALEATFPASDPVSTNRFD